MQKIYRKLLIKHKVSLKITELCACSESHQHEQKLPNANYNTLKSVVH